MRFKKLKDFEISDPEAKNFLLGMEISQFCEGFFLSQKMYASNLLKRIKLGKCDSFATPVFVNEKLMKDDGEERKIQ